MACIGKIVEDSNNCGGRGGVIGFAVAPTSAVETIVYDANGIVTDVTLKAGEAWYAVQGDPTKGTLTWESTTNDDRTTTFTFTGSQVFDLFSRDVYNAIAGYFECCNSFVVLVQTTDGQIVLGPEPYRYLNEFRPTKTGVQLSSSGDFGTLDGENSKTATLTFTVDTQYMSRLTDGIEDFETILNA